MAIEQLNINLFAFLLSGFAAFLLGFVWYHPKVMGSQLKEVAQDQDMKFVQTPMSYIISFFLWVLSACFYAFICGFFDVASVADQQLAAAGYFAISSLLWVAFAMPPAIMGGVYTGRPFDAIAIDASYQLAGYYMFAAVHIAFLFM